MGKTLGYGEITVANMTEPFTVMLTNEAQQFATDSNRKVTSAQSYYTDIIVIRGSQERTDYTIGNITSGSGITVSKNSKRVTFSVSAGTTIGADAGVIEIPITLDGQTVKKQFSWSCGKQGPQGVKGQDGTSIKITSKSVTYQTSTSGTTAPTGTWVTTVPTVANGQYLWTKTTVQYSDGNKTESYSVAYKGTNGTNGTSVTVSKTEVTYQVSTSGTTAPTGTWQATMPSCDQGQYLWTKTYVKYSDGKDTTSYSVSYKGVDGEKFAFNMLRETNQGSKHWEQQSSGGKYSVEDFITEDNINAVKLICTEAISTSNWSYVSFKDIKMLKQLKPSTKYTLSYDIKANRSGTISHSICNGSASNVCTNTVVVNNIIGNETWQHISVVLTTNDLKTTPTNEILYLGRNALSKVGYSIIKNLKLTEGIVDTPWAPHPEDLEGRGVSETIQYYLATSQASGVTSSTSGWSTDITTQKLTADKKYLWNCYQTKYSDGTSEPISTPKVIGVYGDKGQNAKNLSITPSSQYFKSTDGGKTFAPNVITVKPTIQGEISFGKWQYSIDGGVSFADVVSGQKGLTISNNVLTVSKDSSLYSDAVTMITFRAVASDSSFYDTCSIAKIYDVSDIQIGGVNLIKNSNFADGVNKWASTGITCAVETDSTYGHHIKFSSSVAGDSNHRLFADAGSNFNHTKNTTYTLSFYAKASANTQVQSNVAGGANPCNYSLTTSWQRYTTTYKASAAGSLTFWAVESNKDIYLANIKLERGNKPTDYTVSPEDVQTAILSTKSEISDVSLKVDNNKKAIEQKVEKTTYQQDLNLVKGDISKANEGLNKWRYEIYPKSLFASEYQGKSTMDVFAKNTNLTPSQSVLINDTDFGKNWAYGDNYIGYALTFVKFSAAKSVAITFKHDDGAHLYLNGKLIGGDDTCNTGSGESLTLSFIQGWNCLEVVLNEKSGGEYIGLGTTLSALSECQLMNCYYGTPVARQSHITNQLVENTTNIDGISTKVSKVTSVIGEDGENFTSFKNDYSDFKQTMNGFKTTVGQTYVTKDDFNGLEIGGRNLLLYSQTIRAHKDYYGVGWLTDEVETFNGCPVWSVKNQWGRLTWLFKSHVIDRGLVKVGDTLTYSLYAKTNNASGKSINCSYRFKGNTNAYWFNGSAFNVGTNWTRYSVTFTITKDMLATDTYMTEIGFEETASMSGDDKVYYACPKLERGTKATDYTPALEDNEINGQNLVSNLSSNWEQGSVSYVANSTYASIKTVLATRLRTEDVFSVSGNVTISAGTSTNSSKEELNFYYVLFDVNKKAIGVPASGSEWQSLTSPKIINCGDAKYMAIILRWGSGSTAIAPSDISQICLKIERGTSATPFTLAPEDVNGKIVNVETIANQTAKKFEWIVKGGDSSSNFTLTDRVADLVADRINFKGLVTFSGLNTDAKNEIGKVAQSKVDRLEVGGRNLLKHSSMIGEKLVCDNYVGCNNCDTKEYTNEGFHIITPTEGNANNGIAFSFDNFTILGINGGDTITFSCDIKGTSDSHAPFISIHISDNNWYGSDVIQKNTSVSISSSWQRVSVTITTPTGLSKNHMWLAIHGNYQSDLYARNFKLEKGNKATDWMPAPEDYLPQVDLVSNWTTNTTWIDGGKIYTGSITADKIAANAITADKIATDAIKSRNYISSGGAQGSFLNLGDGSFTSPNLSWDSNGNLIAKNANIIGNLTAGTVGEWKIDKYIYSRDKMFFDINKHNGQSIYNKNSTNNLFLGDGKVSSFYWFTTQNNTFIIENGNSPQYATGPAGISFGTNIAQGQIELYESVYPGNIIQDYEQTSHTSELSISGSKISFSYYDSNGSSFSDSPYTYIMADYARFYGDIFVQGSITTDEGVDVGGKLQASSIATKNGGLIETAGTVYGGGEIQCGGGQMRIIGGNYGILLRNDGSDFYILSTDSGSPWGSWNSKRPFRINLANGIPYFEYGIIIPNENYLLGNGYQLARGTSWGGVCIGDDSKRLRLYGTSIWASHSISTSDENLKENFTTLDQYEEFYMNLNPIGFNYIGDYDGKKTHFGFGAHKIEDILESEGYDADKFAVVTHRPLVQEDIEKRFGKDVTVDIETEYGVSYAEFIALNTHMIQKTRRELTKVKQEKADLEARLQIIEAKLGL